MTEKKNIPLGKRDYFPENLDPEPRLDVLRKREICLMGHYVNTDNPASIEANQTERQLQNVRRQIKYCKALIVNFGKKH